MKTHRQESLRNVWLLLVWLILFLWFTVICFVLQKDLVERQREYQQQIKEREKKLQELKEAVKAHKVSFEEKRQRWFS